jgi:gliding motility-associated-like protein
LTLCAIENGVKHAFVKTARSSSTATAAQSKNKKKNGMGLWDVCGIKWQMIKRPPLNATKTPFFTLNRIMKHYSFVLGVLFLFLLPFNVRAQRVEMLCTQTDTLGDITVSWNATGIPAGYEYEVCASKIINGSYDTLDTVSTLTYIHYGAGRSNQWFYTVNAVPVPPATGPVYHSDTLGNIYFYPSKNTEIVLLYWQRPSIPPLPTQDKEFVILCGEGGSMHPWAKTDTTSYVDTTYICGKLLDFQIVLSDSRGCDNSSFIWSNFLKHTMPPTVTPQLDSVSINPNTGETELGWNPSASNDVFGYIIYAKKNGIWQPIDTLYGADNTYYVDLYNDANSNIQYYRIAAIDTCFNSSPMGDTLNTMISNASPKKCYGLVSLSWNAYVNMPDGLTGYRIWASENGGSFYIVDTVPHNILNYAHTGVNEFSVYVYYIQAYNLTNGYTASSTKIEANFNRSKSFGEVWLRYVSVVYNKDIEVAVYVNDTVMFGSLFLFRSENNGTHFSKIGEKTKASGVENYFFTDAKADVQTQTYLYTVSLTDECDEPFGQSDTANNIVLKMLESSSDMNEIAWTAYDGFGLRLDGYDVYRKLQTETDFQFISSLSASQTDYAENVWNLAAQGGKFLYQVSANEDNTNPHGFSDQSFSSVVELTKSPKSFIPNAFTPNGDGLNEVFRPVLTYVDTNGYAFAIFDRWGNQIFYANDIAVGWDGSINGKPAAMGIYQYTLTYRLNPTRMHKEQGHVSLRR